MPLPLRKVHIRPSVRLPVLEAGAHAPTSCPACGASAIPRPRAIGHASYDCGSSYDVDGPSHCLQAPSQTVVGALRTRLNQEGHHQAAATLRRAGFDAAPLALPGHLDELIHALSPDLGETVTRALCAQTYDRWP